MVTITVVNKQGQHRTIDAVDMLHALAYVINMGEGWGDEIVAIQTQRSVCPTCNRPYE